MTNVKMFEMIHWGENYLRYLTERWGIEFDAEQIYQEELNDMWIEEREKRVSDDMHLDWSSILVDYMFDTYPGLLEVRPVVREELSDIYRRAYVNEDVAQKEHLSTSRVFMSDQKSA